MLRNQLLVPQMPAPPKRDACDLCGEPANALSGTVTRGDGMSAVCCSGGCAASFIRSGQVAA